MDASPALTRALALARARTGQEAADLHELRQVAATPDPWSRATPIHVTASAMIVHPPSRRVLLRWHMRQQAWIQVGGHADPGEVDPLQVALREAREETGIDDVRPWPDRRAPEILHAVVVPVPASSKEPAHRHGDLRYVLATDEPDSVAPEDDASPLWWLDLPEAIELTTEPNVRETLRRVEQLLVTSA
jgi:8-oxo-dGTP pyrophosphatase MutT (NUDIX family)